MNNGVQGTASVRYSVKESSSDPWYSYGRRLMAEGKSQNSIDLIRLHTPVQQSAGKLNYCNVRRRADF